MSKAAIQERQKAATEAEAIEFMAATDNPAEASQIASEWTWGKGSRNQQKAKYHRLMLDWYEARP